MRLMALMCEERTRVAKTVDRKVGRLVLWVVRKVAKMGICSVKMTVYWMVGLLVGEKVEWRVDCSAQKMVTRLVDQWDPWMDAKTVAPTVEKKGSRQVATRDVTTDDLTAVWRVGKEWVKPRLREKRQARRGSRSNGANTISSGVPASPRMPPGTLARPRRRASAAVRMGRLGIWRGVGM